ncbi:MAG TPA: AMP-binding protein, partial [Streptosporangiaceae bacterium]|nr:AMP-binding protein [Streptosporangiaceae bacterium]
MAAPTGHRPAGLGRSPARLARPGLLELAASAIAAHPDSIAVTGPQGILTYRDVGTLRDATAAALEDAGVRPGGTVAVLAARGIHLPGVLLGVLAAGARWAILDAAMPPAALTRQLTALRPQAAITFVETGVLRGLPVIKVSSLAGAGGARPVPGRSSGAYLMLTSGTSGEPALL